MKKSKVFKILVFIVLLAIIIIITGYILKKSQKQETVSTSATEVTVIKTDIINTVSSSSYIQSALIENKELHATYYFDEIYFEKNQYINAGEQILKYTNGEYLIAPYNCILTDYSIPEQNAICTNKHYITIQSTDSLIISLSIDEDEIDEIYEGQEASIKIESLNNKEVAGYVTNIDNTASYSSSGSKFNVDVEFQNEGDIMLGMSAKCSIILEKAENTIAVASEAIKNQNRQKTVTVKLSDGSSKDVQIETGISNDAYTEVKSGLNEGDIVLIEENSDQSNSKNMQDKMPQMPDNMKSNKRNTEIMPKENK